MGTPTGQMQLLPAHLLSPQPSHLRGGGKTRTLQVAPQGPSRKVGDCKQPAAEAWSHRLGALCPAPCERPPGARKHSLQERTSYSNVHRRTRCHSTLPSSRGPPRLGRWHSGRCCGQAQVAPQVFSHGSSYPSLTGLHTRGPTTISQPGPGNSGFQSVMAGAPVSFQGSLSLAH